VSISLDISATFLAVSPHEPMIDPVRNLIAQPSLAPAAIEPFLPLAPQDAVLIAAALATCGWLYTARKARSSARKQHTINVIMQGEFNDTFRAAESVVAPHLNNGLPIDIALLSANEKKAFQLVLNRYEFLAAGIRNGDFDERLVLDALRGATVTLYEVCETSIYKQRDTRRRQTLYEHLEWLHTRWKKSPPKAVQRWLEVVLDRPLAGGRVKPD